MVIAAAKALYDQNINYQQLLLVQTQDISEFCVYMTYLQMNFYGIAGTVTCGNTLLLENKFTFYTSMYYLGEWDAKIRCCRMIDLMKELLTTEQKKPEIEKNAVCEVQTEKKLELSKVAVNGYSQIKLW